MEKTAERRRTKVSGEGNETGQEVLALYLSRARRHRLLSRREEENLAARVAAGDEAAWEELVRCNLKLVVSIARGYAGRGLELADLIQEGNLGLMRAARGFESRFGTKFSTYATWWIRQSISRAVANKSSAIRVPIHAAEAERVVNGARKTFHERTGRDPSIKELSGLVDKTPEEVVAALRSRMAVVSYDVPIGNEEDGSLSELLADEEPGTEDVFMEDALKGHVHDLLALLPERERYVVKRRYGLDGGGGATLQEIARGIGVTRERVRQIQATALRRLRSLALEADLDSFLEPSSCPA